jgi:phage shock protein A
MTSQEFESITKKVEQLEKDISKAEGTMEQIMSTLKTQYAINSTKELVDAIEKTESTEVELTKQYNKIANDLSNATDWSKL